MLATACPPEWLSLHPGPPEIHLSAYYPAKPRRMNVSVSCLCKHSTLPRPHWLRFNKQHIPIRKEKSVDCSQTQHLSPESSQPFCLEAILRRTISRKIEAFIRDLHPKTRKSTRTMDELQYLTVKMQKRGASTNFGQFEATPESRKLPNIYLEKLAISIARSTESKHHR